MSTNKEAGGDWKAALEPWANEYAELAASIEEHVKSLDDAGVQRLLDATRKVTQTNCWWATFQSASLVQSECLTEQFRRKRAAAETVEALLTTAPSTRGAGA